MPRMLRLKTGNWTRLIVPLVLSASLLSSCAGVGSSSCPPIVEYDTTFEAMLADELEALESDAIIVIAMVDYYKLRLQIEVCR